MKRVLLALMIFLCFSNVKAIITAYDKENTRVYYDGEKEIAVWTFGEDGELQERAGKDITGEVIINTRGGLRLQEYIKEILFKMELTKPMTKKEW